MRTMLVAPRFYPKLTRFRKVVFVNLSIVTSPIQTKNFSVESSYTQGNFQHVVVPLMPTRESISKFFTWLSSSLRRDCITWH